MAKNTEKVKYTAVLTKVTEDFPRVPVFNLKRYLKVTQPKRIVTGLQVLYKFV